MTATCGNRQGQVNQRGKLKNCSNFFIIPHIFQQSLENGTEVMHIA